MDITDRAKEIVNIFKKIKEMNFGIVYYDEFITFREICNTFIRDGKAVRGDIKVHGTKRIICYDFNKKVECCLKYDESV